MSLTRSIVFKLVLPPLIAIALFGITIFALIIPSYENAMLEDRKQMTRELTNLVWGLLENLDSRVINGENSLEHAQKEAISTINSLRYGYDNKDYFWIIDSDIQMIAHPYRPDLNGKNVAHLRDPKGKRVFSEFAAIVSQHESGFVDYLWQWQDDPSHDVPKISYVRGFKPWGWIVGTGIYTEDVKEQINQLTNWLLGITLFIVSLISGLLAYLAYEGLKIEKARLHARTALIQSKERYEALVEASHDGFILIPENGRMITNSTMINMLGYDDNEFSLLSLSDIIAPVDEQPHNPDTIQALMEGQISQASFEAMLLKKGGVALESMLTTSKLTFADSPATIMIARDLSSETRELRQRIAEEREEIIVELQTTLQHLNRCIRDNLHKLVTCPAETQIHQVARRMNQQDISSIFIAAEDGSIVGIVTDHDIRRRVVAENLDTSSPISSIMTSPVYSIPEHALLFEAAMLMQQHRIQSLAVKNSSGDVFGQIDSVDLLEIHGYSAVSLISALQIAKNPEEIRQRHTKMPMFIKALIDAGSQPNHVNRIISRICEAATLRLIHFALEEMGPAAARFAFVGLGSVGREE